MTRVLAAVCTCILLIGVAGVLSCSHANAIDLPVVEVKPLDYKFIAKANDWTGLPLENAIPRATISRVILTDFKPNRITGNVDREMSEQEIRDFASSVTNALFSKTGVIRQWGVLAQESVMAEIAIVTKSGDIYFVDVLQTIASRHPNAFILRGSGFSVRLPIVNANDRGNPDELLREPEPPSGSN